MISRQFLLGAIISTLLVPVLLTVAIFTWIRGDSIQDAISPIVLSLVLTGVSIWLYYKAYKTKDADSSESVTDYTDIMPFTKFLIHPEIHALNKLIIYNETGNMVGRFLPARSWLRYLEPLFNLLPFKHYVESENGELITLEVRGFFNRKIVVLNESGQKIGTIRQDFFKSLLKFHAHIEVGGETYDIQSDVIFGEAEVQNLFRITTFNVPVEHSERFRRLSKRMYIIDQDLDTNEGKVGLAILCLYASVARGK